MASFDVLNSEQTTGLTFGFSIHGVCPILFEAHKGGTWTLQFKSSDGTWSIPNTTGPLLEASSVTCGRATTIDCTVARSALTLSPLQNGLSSTP